MQKIAISIGQNTVSDMLKAMKSSEWCAEIQGVGEHQIGALFNARHDVLDRAVNGPGLKTLQDGVLAISGLPLLDPPALQRANTIEDIEQLLIRAQGIFAVAHISQKTGLITVITDILGLQPCYLDRRSWCLATDTKPFPYTPSETGWGTLFSFKHLIGSATLIDGVERLPGASIITIDPIKKTTTARRYWHWPQHTRQIATSEVVAALTDNAAAYMKVAGPTTLAFSGGFDSRMILAILQSQQIAPHLLTVSHKDQNLDADGRFARLVSDMVGLAMEEATPDPNFFSTKSFIDYLWANDATFPSLYLFIAQLMPTLEGRAVWEGLMPSALRLVHEPGGGFTRFREIEFPHRQGGFWGVAARLFRPAKLEMLYEAGEAEFLRTTGDFPDDEQGVWQWLKTHRTRNRAGINPSKVYSNVCTPLLFGSSQAYWSLAGQLPYAERDEFRFYKRIFKEHFPHFTRIPFESGSDILNGGQAAWSTWINRKLAAWEAGLSARPRLARLLGVPLSAFPRSAFLDVDAVWREEDDWLDMDAVRKFDLEGRKNGSVAQLLFHWRAARWLHEGRLHKTLLEG